MATPPANPDEPMPIEHSPAYRMRRFLNWFPMGLAYALLYMGRYNLTVSKNVLGEAMTKEDFGIIFGAGTLTYGLAFLLNGPLTDKMGGRKAILIALIGSAVMNILMGLYLGYVAAGGVAGGSIRTMFSMLYAGNMYFQSFAAVAIVKVNAHWFHVRERGGFSGIFGTMISSGIFLAFTVNPWILDLVGTGGGSQLLSARWVFFAPASLMLIMLVVEWFMLRDKPSQAGHEDFDTGDASSGEEGVDIPITQIMKRILTNPIILTVAFVELCTGVLRNGVMHWYPIYAKEVLVLPGSHYLRHGSWSAWYVVATIFAIGVGFIYMATRSTGKRKAWYFVSGGLIFLAPFLQAGWGGILMVAGVLGGNIAGWVSDLFFQSRRAPAAGGLYGILVVAAIAMFFAMGETMPIVDWAEPPKVAAAAPGAGGDLPLSAGAMTATSASASTMTATSASASAMTTTVVPGTALPAAPAPSAIPANLGHLQPGDEIVAIAGTTEISDWTDVSRAIRCVPAACEGSAQWDTVRCICASKPKATLPPGTPTSDGYIPATVMRAGLRLDMVIRDPSPTMRAGDSRGLKAGPVPTLSPLWLGLVVFLVSLCVIGTHGLLSGTATMDFGGRKGAATAVGLIDGFVYLGTAIQSFSLGYLTSIDWSYWPLFLVPFGVLGFYLLTRIWNAKPKGKGK